MKTFQNAEQFLQKLRLFFYVNVLAPLILFLVSYFMQKDGKITPSAPELGEGWMSNLIQIICLVSCGAAYWIYQQQIKSLRDLPTLRQKLEGLFKISVIKYALLEFSNLLAAIFFWITANHLFMIVFAATLVLFLMSNPSVYSIMNDLKVNAEEKDIIKQNKDIL